MNELHNALKNLDRFTDEELESILDHCSDYTMRDAVDACNQLGIELTGDDVEEMLWGLD